MLRHALGLSKKTLRYFTVSTGTFAACSTP